MRSLWHWLNSPAGDAALFDLAVWAWAATLAVLFFGLPLLRVGIPVVYVEKRRRKAVKQVNRPAALLLWPSVDPCREKGVEKMKNVVAISFLVVLNSLVMERTAVAQTAPGQTHACNARTGQPVGYISLAAPELALGFVVECPVGTLTHSPYPVPPEPIAGPPLLAEPEPELPRIQVGRYYKTAYGSVLRITGVVSILDRQGEPEDYWLYQHVTPNGGVCGYLGIHTTAWPIGSIVGEVPAQKFPVGCPLAFEIRQ